MKIKIHLNCPNIKIGYDGKIESLGNQSKLPKLPLFEIDLDLIYMAYKMFPNDETNPFAQIYKFLEKYINKNKPPKTYENIDDKPDAMPANGHDIYNYVARFGIANYQIQTVLELDGKLDYEKLRQAVRLSVDAAPVFGCRFVENEPPYWKRLENLDNTPFCSFEETAKADDAILRFLEAPLDMDKDPMVKLKLIRSHSYDTLCIKVNHACTDGTGTKEYICLLSEIYNTIENNEIFTPHPVKRSRNDQDRLFRELGIEDPDTAWDGSLDIPQTLWSFPWHTGKPHIARVASCKLPEGYIDQMYKYGKLNCATINDILLTAYYRAMFEMSQPEPGIPMDISITVDLRRYLPDKKTEDIRCFSGGLNTKLPKVLNEPFSGTLARVVSMTSEIKKGTPGLQSAVGLERVEKAKFHETVPFYQAAGQCLGYLDKCSPVLSNLGFLDKSLYKFGSRHVIDAYVVPPAVSAPGVLICIGTYNEVITIATSYYSNQVDSDVIDTLLKLIKKELLEGCRIE